MTTRLALVAATCLLGIESADAVVTSDGVGTHVVPPGASAYGISLDGVVIVGEMPPSGQPLMHCSGALISDRHVLTAAHCFDEDEDGAVDFLFELFPQSVLFDLAEGYVVVPHDVGAIQWPAGWPAGQADLAVLTLSEDAPAGVPRYPLYGGRGEVGQAFVLAGYGRGGYGAAGEAADEERPPVKRAGLNRFDAVRDDIPGVELLAYDFDSGLPAHNSLALIDGVQSDLGFGLEEVLQASGDSGGPSFLRGAVAAVSSFTARIPSADATAAKDSSWGEGGFNVRVSYFREFLLGATGGAATFVPEPSALALLLAAWSAATRLRPRPPRWNEPLRKLRARVR